MKLKPFDFSKAAVRHGAPSFAINTNGVMRINPHAAKMIGLTLGDHVEIHEDEDEPGDWYLAKAENTKTGAELRKSGNSEWLMFNSADLARRILESVSYRETSGSMLISKDASSLEGVDYWPLITASLKKRTKK